MNDSNSELPEHPAPDSGQPSPPVPPASGRQPMFNLPTSLVTVVGFMAALFVVQTYLLSGDWDDYITFTFGFIPARYVYPLFAGDYAWAWTPVTYSFLHGNPQHLIFNCVWLVCFGTPVVRRIGTVRSVAFWILSAIASVGVFAGLHWADGILVIGASGVISAFTGAACRFAFPPRGLHFSRRPVYAYPLLSLSQVFSSRAAITFLASWLLGNVLVAAGLPIAGSPGAVVAWEAHIGGLLFGLLAFPLFDRRVSADTTLA
nr:rhomboid family intramembrane serine protease [uncultured Gellertiella sp.]